MQTQKCNMIGKQKRALFKFDSYEALKHVGAHAGKEAKYKIIFEYLLFGLQTMNMFRMTLFFIMNIFLKLSISYPIGASNQT